jgi:hypothetical protein
MAFGIMFDFTSNAKNTKVIPHEELLQQTWFQNAVKRPDYDVILLLGHNPVGEDEDSTFRQIVDGIRKMRPDVPIQGFGGHNHIRDFRVYDDMSTGMSSGRYCETLGWFSMSNIQSKTSKAANFPIGVPHPSQRAIAVNHNPSQQSREVAAVVDRNETCGDSISQRSGIGASCSRKPLYSRRYLDWNRLTFSYHAKGSQDTTFDTSKGTEITEHITQERQKLKLDKLIACAPQTWCKMCKKFGDPGSVYTLVKQALAKVVISKDRNRKAQSRIIIFNRGGIRSDLIKGPFTLDDAFIVSPFPNPFYYIPDVPYDIAMVSSRRRWN